MNEHFNVDVYHPLPIHFQQDATPLEGTPAIIIITGVGGKDFITGGAFCGKYAVAYHDLAQHLADAGFYVLVPSRRGDPQRTREYVASISGKFKNRLPEDFFCDEQPNEGSHSHLRQIEELKTLIKRMPDLGAGVDKNRIGIIGKSAGGGIALRLASEVQSDIKSLALWGSSLRTSQWFNGLKDTFIERILTARKIRFDREEFLSEICDAIDVVGEVSAPVLFACAAHDPFAPEPPELDVYSNPEEQVQLMRYAISSRYVRVAIVKGAEHTMYRGLPSWQNYANTLQSWFQETLLGY